MRYENESNNEIYIKNNLAKEYELDIEKQKQKYFFEKEQKLKSELAELSLEHHQIEDLNKQEAEKRKQLIQKQYQEYLIGLQSKEKKIQKEFEEKLIPLSVSLPMNSDMNLNNYHNNIYRLSDIADRNRKLFMEYNEKTKNQKHYNYLSKRYCCDKETNQTIENNKMIPLSQRVNKQFKNEIYNQNNDANIPFNYKNSYDKYKNLYKEYNDYNKLLAEKNIKNKEMQIKQRALQEEKRNERAQQLYNLEKEEKFFDDERKRLYKNFLQKQMQEKIPIKLSNEKYDENNMRNYGNNFRNVVLYDSIPHYSTINRNKFVEVNPFCSKNYDLGKSNLENNIILNPTFNYGYNKYLFKKGLNKSKSSYFNTRGRYMDLENNLYHNNYGVNINNNSNNNMNNNNLNNINENGNNNQMFANENEYNNQMLAKYENYLQNKNN